MKQCRRCGENKPTREFYSQQQKERGKTYKYLDSYCKSCRSAYTTKRRKDLKKEAVEYLGGKCKKCQVKDHPAIYDFHHPSDKDFSVSSKGTNTLENIKAELDKCELLCANCHRKHHLA